MLKDQVNCGFKSFAINRLGLEASETPSDLPGPLEKGVVVHEALARLFAKRHSKQAMESVSIKMRDKPLTVGHGSDKIELLSRTPEEKSQFRRNKNVIIWSIGALLILLTMLVMLNFT